MARKMEPNQEVDALLIGRRYLHDQSYKRQKKEIDIGHIKIDVLRKEEGQLVIGEVKKSSRFQKSAKMQLAFYLRELKMIGIDAKGELLFPEEKKKVQVFLTSEIEKELEQVIQEIEAISYQELPPKPEWSRYCKKCAYQELCWA